jgi:hypothetical protein
MAPSHGLAHANRGVAYKNMGEYKRAAVDLQKSMSLLTDPKRVSQVKRHLEQTESHIKSSEPAQAQPLFLQDQQTFMDWPVQSPYW